MSFRLGAHDFRLALLVSGMKWMRKLACFLDQDCRPGSFRRNSTTQKRCGKQQRPCFVLSASEKKIAPDIYALLHWFVLHLSYSATLWSNLYAVEAVVSVWSNPNPTMLRLCGWNRSYPPRQWYWRSMLATCKELELLSSVNCLANCAHRCTTKELMRIARTIFSFIGPSGAHLPAPWLMTWNPGHPSNGLHPRIFPPESSRKHRESRQDRSAVNVTGRVIRPSPANSV